MNKGNLVMVIIYIIVLIVIIIGMIGGIALDYSNEKTIQVEIKDKYVKGQEGLYIVIDTENNAYKITDLLFIGKFNSTDIYNELEIGHRYEITTTGYRIRFFSEYPNINEVKFIK